MRYFCPSLLLSPCLHSPVTTSLFSDHFILTTSCSVVSSKTDVLPTVPYESILTTKHHGMVGDALVRQQGSSCLEGREREQMTGNGKERERRNREGQKCPLKGR
ncbi:hypothetical protein NE237_026952 [Protea cynaroides]|uniref:Uncharacterized protein n=1 Tax=Protea cynaroides TaxID=273540 RepID=A0A9Q0JTR8_9MAGN|nr:hypothetical protein NE237_026952 [Protea cynaroides]